MKKTENYAMPYPEQDDYFNVEDFQDMMVSVDNLMKKISDSGSQISSDAEHLYNQTKAQMDNIQKRMNTFTSLKDGSTTGDAELEDIRVAYDGKEYGNAGEAVREQASDIHKALFGAGASIWSKAKSESTKYVAETKGICILNERFTAAGVVTKISRGIFAENESTLNLDRECSAYIVEFEKNPGTVYMPSAETVKIVSTTKIIFEANGNARCWIPVEKGQYLAVDSTATAYTSESNHVPYMLYDQANKTLECRGFGSTGSIEPVDPYSLALEYKLEYDMDDTGLVKQIDANGEAAASLKEDIEYFEDDINKVFNATENLYNSHSLTNIKGVALTIADGTEYVDSSTVNAITTGYFDTNEGDVWRFYRWNTAMSNIFGMEVRVHWFDENEKYISGAIITGDVTAPKNARRLRFTEKFTSLYPTLAVMVTKNYSFGLNDYVPYGIKQLKESFLPKKTYELTQRNGTLHNGDSWVLENNNIMARKVFILSGIVNTFSTLEMGHGTKTNSPSSWIVVDNENITVYSTPSQKVTVAHGLTIKNIIQIIIEVDTNYKAKITIVSNGEKYNTEQDWDGNIGNIFVKSVDTELADCDVSWTCKNYSSPIWAYGDSYFGMTNKARWIAQLLTNGYGTNMLIDGYPGRASDDAYNSLQATLKHGKPKYILWAMGMNNPDNDSSVNASWNEKFNAVKDLCTENDITLIGCTIPNTPTQFNSYKNNIVRNSGVRYIDFAKSVGAEHMGDSWYAGMLSSDNVHPTEKGAITLYLQALVDFPELVSAN